MPHPAVLRRLSEAQIAEVVALAARVEAATGHRPLNDHLWTDLRRGGLHGFAACEIRGDAATGDAATGGAATGDPAVGRLRAYAQVSRVGGAWNLDLLVDPAAAGGAGPDARATAAAATIPALLDVVGRDGGGDVHWWVPAPDAAAAAIADAHGMRRTRAITQYRVALPLPAEVAHAAGRVATRAFSRGVDDETWLRVNNLAFVGHPEEGDWTRASLDARLDAAWSVTLDILVHDAATAASDAPSLDAFCWVKMHLDATPPMGEIYKIAVDPARQGTGLGRAMVVAGLAHMRTRGASVAMLYVDDANAPAVALYRSLGFAPHHSEHAYTAHV
ncbi:MAG: acetyltransferase MshD [Actinomycetota bacterium]